MKYSYLCVAFKELKDEKGLREVLFWFRQVPDPDRAPVMLGPGQISQGSDWFNETEKRFWFDHLERLYRNCYVVVSEGENAYWGPPFSKVMF